jgi:mRNA interferase RelE/StbE
MKIHVEKKARKDIDNLPITIRKLVQKALLGILEVNEISEISNCKKLRGDKLSYSIRISKYRIGFKYEEERINIYRVLHRKEIYSRFP